MDVRLGLGCVSALCALWVLLKMEPGLQRYVRMRWNAWQRRRVRAWMRAGFAMKRATNFRDGGVIS